MVLTAIGDVELSDPDLQRRDAEAEGLCHEMTERLKLLHDERAVLSAHLRELSARKPSVRLIAADNALAAMATAGLVGAFAGAAAARFLFARRPCRTGRKDGNTAGGSPHSKAAT